MPSSADMMRDLNNVNNTLNNEFLGVIPDDIPSIDRGRKLKEMQTGLSQTENISDKAQKNIENAIEDIKEVSAKSYFNIIKNAQDIELLDQMNTNINSDTNADMPVNEINSPIDNNAELFSFSDAASIREKLNSFNNVDDALAFFMPLVSDDKVQKEDGSVSGFVNPKQVLSDSVKSYFEGVGSISDQEQLELASIIFDMLPSSVKKDNNEMVMTEKQVAAMINDSNKAIYILAKSLVSSSKNNNRNTFNLKKVAQHKDLGKAILTGPEETKIDSLTGNLISDLHVIERNKGFGIKIDNLLDVDYEALWRQNVMDKYSRPYRDKEGKWVGGYLNKRFEINYNVPVGNDYQLKPGQKRKPVLQQYGNIGSRLEHARDNDLLNPLSKSASYNSNIKNSTFNLKKKVAQLKPLPGLKDPFSSPEEDRKNKVSTSKSCPVCHSTNNANNSKCSNCGMLLNDVKITYHPHVVSPKSVKNTTVATPFNIVADVNDIKNNIKPKNKINPLLLSDPEAENINTEHIEDVAHSADHLAM